MYFLALAADYDGTLAENGIVPPATLDALRRFKASGRRIILVTGRELPELKAVCPDWAIFDRIVAENGALLCDPAEGSERLIASPPPRVLVERLHALKVEPLSVGRGIIATWEPHEATVLAAIRALGLELQIIFNRGAVMILPPGVSKASGLQEALADLRLSPHNVVGVGDGENDHSFLSVCGCSAAVANAVPTLLTEADIQLTAEAGAGVAELIGRIMREDVCLAPLAKHGIRFGTDRAGEAAFLTPPDGHVLIVGPSGCGKSTLVTALTEQMADRGFTFCTLDPEGDYYELQHAVCVGSVARPPDVRDAMKLQQDTGANIVVNTQALNLGARQKLFRRLLNEASRLREISGRPHWLVIDEAHEVLPAGNPAGAHTGPMQALGEMTPAAIFVTLVPESIDARALAAIRTVLAFGDVPAALLTPFAQMRGIPLPGALPVPNHGELLLWRPGRDDARIVRPIMPRQRHRRHVGKYAVGDVGEWHSFYFRGSDNRLNRPARNLYDFMEVADDVDDATWQHHLRAGDYSAWFRNVIRDQGLARDAQAIEADDAIKPGESRRLIRKAIWRRYAAPCECQTCSA